MSDKKVEYIGIGAQKCSSSWVFEVLSTHPLVNVSTKKEVNFFTNYFDRGYSWYKNQFVNNSSGILFENSPSYFCCTDAPKRVFEYNPRMKIIVGLRNPIERTYSNYLHEIVKGHIGKNVTFDDAIRENPMYIEQSLYYKHLTKWLVYFDIDNILFVFQENVRDNPDIELERICNFIGIDSKDINANPKSRYNESIIYKRIYIKFITQLVGSVLKKTLDDKIIKIIKSNSIINFILKSNKESVRENVKALTPKQKVALKKIFFDDYRKLSSLIGSDIPWGCDLDG